MADNTTQQLTIEETASLAAIPTPAPQAEEVAPMVLAANTVQTSTQVAAMTESALPAEGAKSGNYNVVVKAPPAGGMLAYLVGPGATIELQGIDLNNAKVSEEAGNLRITLPNGAEVLLLDYVNSAQNPDTVIVTPEGKLPAQQLLAALDETQIAQNVQDVEPAAGPTAGGEGGGLLPPTILGTGVGEGEGIFSSVIGPFAIPVVRDAIYTEVIPVEGIAPLQPGTPPNLPPLAQDDRFSGVKGVDTIITPAQLLVNDSDPENNPIEVISVQGATAGYGASVTIGADGKVTFYAGTVSATDNTPFQGTGSFSYTIRDLVGGGTSTADVTIQIDPDAPNENNVIAADDSATVVAGRSVTIDILANDSDPEAARGDFIVPGSVRVLNGPASGSVVVNADGTLTYTSVDTGATTPQFVTLVYEVSDNLGARDTATVTIEITPSANNVIAVDDTGEIFPAGATKTFNVTGNDVDPQGDAFQITRIVSGPAQGRAVIDPANGTITYESVSSNTGYTETIVYEITDARGAKDTATLTIRVEPTNSVNAVDDTADMLAGQDVVIRVLANDTDPQGDRILENSVRIVTGPVDSATGATRGSLVVNPDGTVRFIDTPDARNSGVVEFSYEITDDRGAKDIAVVRITIDPAVNGVDANNDTLMVSQDAPRADITDRILANDFDAQGDDFEVVGITQPTVGQGTVELIGDRVFFTPANGYNGPVVFSYTIRDEHGAQDTAQVYINVQEPLNTDLNAGDDNFSTPFNTNLTISAAQLLSNDSDPDGSTLNASNIVAINGNAFTAGNVITVANGTLTVGADGNFLFNPTDTFRGTTSFTYTIRDAQGDTDTATVVIRVGDPLSQDNPVDAVDDRFVTNEDTPLNFSVSTLLTNDSAPDGGLKFERIVGPLPAGLVFNEATGQFTYTPAANWSGTVDFQYEVSDVDGDKDIATVTIVTNPVNDPVDAVNDAFTTNEDTPISFTVANILANDSAPDGGLAFVRTVGALPAGLVFNEVAGTFTYTPAPNWSGSVSFQYEVRDVDGDTDIATVTIVTNPVNDPVDAVNDAFTTLEDTPISFTVANILANDSAPDGGLQFTRVVGALPAGLSFDGTTFTYNPPANFNGQVSFQYEVRDVDGDTDIATVVINVTPVNDGVDARDDAFTTAFNTNLTITPAQLLTNDVDLDTGTNAGLNIIDFTQPANGTITRDASGNFIYNPNDTFTGTDSFTYTIRDAQGEVDTATVRIVVSPFNDVDARDDSASVVAGAAVAINVLANDVDAQGDPFSIVRFTQPARGTVTQNADGTFTYQSTGRDAYDTSFTYTIRDSKGAEDTATVVVHVAAAFNDVDARDDATSVTAGQAVRVNVIANDVDPQGDAFNVTNFTQPAVGAVTWNGDGTFTYHSVGRDAYSTSFTYQITDAKGASDWATVHINVAAAANNVVAIDDGYNAGPAGNTIQFNVLGNDYDPQGDGFSIVAINNAPAGLTYHGNGVFTFTGQGRTAYDTAFTYVIQDTRGAQSAATVYLHVDAAPNNLVAQNDSYTTTDSNNINFNVLANDYDPQGDAFNIVAINGAPAGLVYHGNGNFSFSSPFGGPYDTAFTYVIRDAYGAESAATVYISVRGGFPGNNQPEGSGGGGGDCPLTIDLLGDGIRINMLANSTAHFDLNGDGHAEWTSWISGTDDAILAIDRNGNGSIDGISEVFGGRGVDGFSELARLEDSNGDGIIDANDKNFANLRLWLDANHDGITDEGELHTLAEFGIISIDTRAGETSIQYGDAYISHQGTVTLADGSTLGASSVFYTNNSNGELNGTAKNDVLVYSSAADSIDGGQGFDTLKVMDSANIVIGHDKVNGIEAIDLVNKGADKLSLDINDVLNISDNGILMVRGDAVDEITLTGGATRGEDVSKDGHTYASYTAQNGGSVLVELGLNVHTDQNQH